MSNESTSIILVQKRLVEWGHWSYKIETMGLSYSSESIFMQLAKEHGMLSSNFKFQEQVEEMETLIERMAAVEVGFEARVNWGKVVRLHYTRFQEKIPLRIQLSHLSRPTYYRYLSDAHEWLAEQLFL